MSSVAILTLIADGAMGGLLLIALGLSLAALLIGRGA